MGYYTRVYNSDLPSRAVMVYMYLKDRADVNGQCYPSIATMSKDLKLSRSTVKRAVADLAKAGLVTRDQRWRENGGKSSNIYFLI